MSQRDDTGFKTYVANGAISLYDRVKIESAGTVAVAGLAERCIGTAYNSAVASGAPVAVKLWTAPGTHKVRVKEACTRGALLYTEAAGEVQDTDQATAFVLGTALETATAEDDIIEMMYGVQPDIAST